LTLAQNLPVHGDVFLQAAERKIRISWMRESWTTFEPWAEGLKHLGKVDRIDLAGLARHERAVGRDLELLGVPAANWPARVEDATGRPVLDVLIVGAGMNGIAAAGSLLFKGVRNIAVVERSRPGQEGPWLTFARMDTLRSPKALTGPALGVPSLTFRAWYEAKYGLTAWERLYKIQNRTWVEYLTWLQQRLALPVRHGVGLQMLEPAGHFVRAMLEEDGTRRNVLARRVILATGRAGAGGVFWPEFVDRALAPDLAAHTNDEIDFEALRGKSIAILGGGASAWDNAATALERGAARVDMYVRRPYLPQVNKGRGSAFPGFLHGWSSLPDAERWATMVYLNDLQAPVPHETVNRTIRHGGFHIHFRTSVETACRADGKLAVRLAGQEQPMRHDFLIVATGFNVDPALIPELANYAPNIATWRDRHQPAPDLRRSDLEKFPYLGPGFELTAKTPGSDPTLGQIHLVNFGAHASHAGIASDIPGVNIAAERVAGAIVTSLFREDIDYMRRKVEAYNEPELAGTPFFVPESERG
jgi:cation diffusion facilitator CzcD-associated flavoprotein CzcO